MLILREHLNLTPASQIQISAKKEHQSKLRYLRTEANRPLLIRACTLKETAGKQTVVAETSQLGYQERYRLRWPGRAERKDDVDWMKRCVTMEVDGTTEQDRGVVVRGRLDGRHCIKGRI